MTRPALSALAFCAVLATAACESSEERAEEHFEEGAALLAAGDLDRAIVEFRNVFRLEGTHREARRLLAQAEIERGNVRAGYGQYLRLVEQYPDDVDARRELTRLALRSGQWEEVEKHALTVIDADAADPVGRLADVALRYRTAVEAGETDALAQIAGDADALREALPGNPLIPELLADFYTREGRREAALDAISAALDASGDAPRLYRMRLALLEEMGDLDGVEATLREMVDLFPEDPAVPATLIRWYLSKDRVAEAEAFLRDRAAAGGAPEKIDLVRFVVEYRGRDAAITELEGLMAGDSANAPLYRSVRASLAFEAGRRDEAIAELEAIVDAATEDTEQLRNVKIALARMLEQTGNRVGARALVEDVLATDSTNTEALKMRAAWLIDADETDAAIQALRSALDQSPRDPALMTLMAQAYERAGNRALMAEMLSLAVEVSNGAPAESLRYARYRLGADKQDLAERTLIDSLRLNPGDPELLGLLGSIHIAQGDWSRADQVAESLSSIGTAETAAAARALRAQALAGQGQSDEVVDLLQELVSSGGAGFGADVAIVRTHVDSGQPDAAMRYVDDRLADAPGDPTLRFLRATVLEVQGRPEEAEAAFAELTEETPDAVLLWRALYLLQLRDGRPEEAARTLDAALEANPEAADLLWIRASQLQNDGDFEEALAIYQEMYERDSSAPIIANNYASLLTMLRDDEASIERAYAVARRLQGLEVPAFQDTYGWIAFLRGDNAAALEHLVPAAEALPDDPSVQFHVAMAYDAAGRDAAATEALRRAVELADGGSDFPQIEMARAKLAELESAGN